MIQMTAIGRLGKDSEVRDVKDKKVCNFSIAVDTGYGEKKKTVWISCSLWNREPVYKWLKKGTLVYVQGEPSARAYTSKTDGGANASLELIVNELKFVGGSQNGQQEQSDTVFVSGSTAPTERPVPAKSERTAAQFMEHLSSSREDSDLPF